MILSYPLQWRHNGRDGVSNHQSHDCLLNRLLRRRSKKTSELRVTGLCAGNSPGTGEFPAQMASYAENVSIWWRHHDQSELLMISATLQSPTTCSIVCALGKNPGSVSNWKFVCLYFHLFCNPHFACLWHFVGLRLGMSISPSHIQGRYSGYVFSQLKCQSVMLITLFSRWARAMYKFIFSKMIFHTYVRPPWVNWH